jgi:hypothetical protein
VAGNSGDEPVVGLGQQAHLYPASFFTPSLIVRQSFESK